jgi:hypothetical protein
VGTSKTLGYHNKPTGCGASGTYALGPDEKKKKNPLGHSRPLMGLLYVLPMYIYDNITLDSSQNMKIFREKL